MKHAALSRATPWAALVTVSALALMIVSISIGSGCRPSASDSAPFPQRSIELIVPWAAGGGTDRMARFLADALQRRFGQPVIVVNRTGGSGAVGHTAGALASPDGYSVTMTTFELSTMRAMGIAPLTWQAFTPVAQVNADAAAVLVRHDAPWKTLPQFLEAIRAQPGQFKMSGTATGGAWDLARSGLLLAAALSPGHVIWAPTQGSAPALVELLGGHIDAVCCSVPEAWSQLEGGRLRVLAVLGPQRLPLFPDYPTAREQGVTYDAVGWRGLMLPKGTPETIVQVFRTALVEISQSADFADFIKKNGFGVEVRTGSDFADYLARQEELWAGVIRAAGYDTLGRNRDPGPYALPGLLLGLLVVTLVVETVRTRRQARSHRIPPASPDESASERGLSQSAVWFIGALVLYTLAIPRLGFMGSTAIFSLGMMWVLGTRGWRALVGTAVLLAGIHLLFGVLFQVPLP